MKQFLLTMDHGSVNPINHGEVQIDDRGFVNGETPVEDFGMFYVRDTPFPTCKDEQFKIFLDLIKAQET